MPLFTRRGVVLVNKPGALEMTMPDDDQHALHIAKVKSTDVGQLIFMVNNQYGSDLCTLQLAMAGESSLIFFNLSCTSAAMHGRAGNYSFVQFIRFVTF